MTPVEVKSIELKTVIRAHLLMLAAHDAILSAKYKLDQSPDGRVVSGSLPWMEWLLARMDGYEHSQITAPAHVLALLALASDLAGQAATAIVNKEA